MSDEKKPLPPGLINQTNRPREDSENERPKNVPPGLINSTKWPPDNSEPSA